MRNFSNFRPPLFCWDTLTQRQWYTIVILCQGTPPTLYCTWFQVRNIWKPPSIHRNGQVSRRLRSGGGGLRAELRSECLGQPPPQLPDFTREPLNPKKETSRCGTWKLVVWGCYKLKNWCDFAGAEQKGDNGATLDLLWIWAAWRRCSCWTGRVLLNGTWLKVTAGNNPCHDRSASNAVNLGCTLNSQWNGSNNNVKCHDLDGFWKLSMLK